MVPKLFPYLAIACISGVIGFQVRAKAAPTLDTLACAESALQATQQVFDTLQFWR